MRLCFSQVNKIFLNNWFRNYNKGSILLLRDNFFIIPFDCIVMLSWFILFLSNGINSFFVIINLFWISFSDWLSAGCVLFGQWVCSWGATCSWWSLWFLRCVIVLFSLFSLLLWFRCLWPRKSYFWIYLRIIHRLSKNASTIFFILMT